MHRNADSLRGVGATTDDPLKDLHPAPDPVARHEKRQPYDEEAVAALIAHAEGPDLLVVLLGAHAGLRVSEMTALRWADVDLSRRRLVVRSGKGGKKRTVPLSSTLVAALTKAARESTAEACVLPYRDRLAVWYRLCALARRAGVTPMGVHSLRHYAGARLTRENYGNLHPAQKMLGHESIVTTEVYAAWSDESLADRLTAWLTARQSRTLLLWRGARASMGPRCSRKYREPRVLCPACCWITDATITLAALQVKERVH